MENADNFNRVFSGSINNHERETGDCEFTCTKLASSATKERHFLQSVGGVINGHGGAAGLRGSKSPFRVVTNMRKVGRRWLGPTNYHLRRIPGFDYSANVLVLNELAFIGSSHSLINFAGEPFVIAEKAFYRFLNKSFRRAALRRR